MKNYVFPPRTDLNESLVFFLKPLNPQLPIPRAGIGLQQRQLSYYPAGRFVRHLQGERTGSGFTLGGEPAKGAMAAIVVKGKAV